MDQPHIVILGSTGLLGSNLTKYFNSKKWIVHSLTRKNIDVEDLIQKNPPNKDILFDHEEVKKELFSKLNFSRDQIVINAIGLTNKIDTSPEKFNFINGYFPSILDEICYINKWKFFHPSTDCVFSGKKSYPLSYSENDITDAEDIYGKSKILGEKDIKWGMVIRCSFVGFDNYHHRGLLEWVKQEGSRGNIIKGYTNHWWNGITVNEYGRLLEFLITHPQQYRSGIVNIDPGYRLNKYQLIKIFLEKWNPDYPITPELSKTDNNKILSSIFPLNFQFKSFPQQIEDL